jgi:hypothetical protein
MCAPVLSRNGFLTHGFRCWQDSEREAAFLYGQKSRDAIVACMGELLDEACSELIAMLDERCGDDILSVERMMDCLRTGLLKSYSDETDELAFSTVIQRKLMSGTVGVPRLEQCLNDALELVSGEDRPTTKLLKIVSEELSEKVNLVAEAEVQKQLKGRVKCFIEENYQVSHRFPAPSWPVSRSVPGIHDSFKTRCNASSPAGTRIFSA